MCAWLVGLLETLEAIFGRQRFCTCVVCWGCSNLAELTGFPVQVLGMGNSQNTFPQFGFFYGSENEPPSRFDDKLESRLILAKPLTGLARTLRGVTPPTAVDENFEGPRVLGGTGPPRFCRQLGGGGNLSTMGVGYARLAGGPTMPGAMPMGPSGNG